MNRETLLLIAVMIVLPGAFFLSALWYLRSDRFKRSAHSRYHFPLFDLRLVLTREALAKVGVLLFLFWWLDEFLPLPVSAAVTVIALASLGGLRRVEEKDLDTTSTQLLGTLNQMQGQIDSVKRHIASLGTELSTTQGELSEKQKVRQALETEILKKSKEAETWASMTEEQRGVFIDSAVNAMSREARTSFWWGLLWGFVINLAAALVWALLGNPGKEDILKQFHTIGGWLK